ncbi:MAG TPA: hypothetical protein VH414_07145 [Lichenihabitans sp.]|nr:hypothetical protein [Lichenihabitans sp.]
MRSTRRGRMAVVAASIGLSLLAVPALAADTHERGTISAVDGSIVKVATRNGTTVSLDLADGWKILGVEKASMTDIKQGTFIGTATMPGANDAMKAMEVVVFPDAMRGTGEGYYPWDLQPKSMMTNATVTHAVKEVDGQKVTLAYKGGEKTVTIGDRTPVVQIVPGDKADVKSGANVFISTPSVADGKLAKGAILIGKDGVTPPM